jgi:hypothetical protein
MRYATGNWWELTPGEDHDQGSRAALEAARTWARRNGYQVEAQLPPPRDGVHAPWRIRLTKIEGVPRGA